MDNQHRKIKGYRDLTQAEIDLMNEIKQKGIELDALVEKVRQHGTTTDGSGEPIRWAAIARTDLQQGLMALTRSVARPEFF